MNPCPYCDGTGRVLTGRGALRHIRPCPSAACREQAAGRTLAAWDDTTLGGHHTMTQSHGAALKRAKEQAKTSQRRRRLRLDSAKAREDARYAAWAAENLRRLRAESTIAREQLGDAA